MAIGTFKRTLLPRISLHMPIEVIRKLDRLKLKLRKRSRAEVIAELIEKASK